MRARVVDWWMDTIRRTVAEVFSALKGVHQHWVSTELRSDTRYCIHRLRNWASKLITC